MRDSMVAGIIAGMIAGVMHWLIGLIFIGFGVSTTSVIVVSAAIVLPKFLLNSWFGIFIGWIVHLLISIFYSLLTVYLVRKTGRDYFFIKAIAFGVGVWVLNIAILAPLMPVSQVVPAIRSDAGTMISLLTSTVGYSLISWFIIVRYGKFFARDIV